MLTLAQLLRIPHVDSGLRFDISPDEGRLVFAWNKSGRWDLWEFQLQERSLASSAGAREARCLTSEVGGSKFSPVYSPDGTKLAYALDPDGSESYHIVVQDLSENTSRDLTPRIAYAHRPNFSWSPDSRLLAVLSDKHGQFALHLLPADGTPGRMIKNVFHPCRDAKWSPDGLWIAIEADSSGCDKSIYVMPINRPRKGSRVNTTQLRINGQILNAQHPAWSADSKTLAFSGENGEWQDIGLYDVETHEISWVNESPGDDTQPAWSRNGESIGWVHSDGARTSFEFRDGNGMLNEKKVGDGVHHHPQFTVDSVIILYEDTGRPCDLWSTNLEDGSVQQLTYSAPEELQSAEFIPPEKVCYASKGGAEVPALLYRAQNSTRAVINIHGGPDQQYQNLWDPMMSDLVSRGWTVLVPNYRGSTGQGRNWQSASRYDMGGVDTDDCAAGANYLIENKLADKNKVVVTGRGYGGFLTISCMTRYPQLWAGGSAVVPFLNWLTSHKNSREDLQHWNIENMGDPKENRELWIAHSPYFSLDKVKAPLQIVCGRNDSRFPSSGSIDARDKLIELGKAVDLLIYEGEGHTFLRTENVVDADERRVAFMAKALEK